MGRLIVQRVFFTACPNMPSETKPTLDWILLRRRNEASVRKMAFALLNLTLLFFVLSPGTVHAATITAASCSQAHVTSALSSAATGDTVLVPAGTCTWTSRVTIPSVALTLQGAGSDATVIKDGTDYGSSSSGLLAWTTVNSGLHRITGFTFDGNAGLANDCCNKGMLTFGGNSHSFRFDHNKVITERTAAGFFRGNIWGVIDHNDFRLHDFKFGFYTLHNSYGGNDNGCSGTVANGCGDASFATPTNLGTQGSIYFEDNTFTSDGQGLNYFADGWAGARTVYRFNTITDVVWDMHGTESAGRSRGTRSFEVYSNVANFPVTTSPSVFGTRSGTGVVFNNRATYSGSGFLTRVFDMNNYRSDPSCSICPPPFGRCNGTNPWDQNAGPQTGYACLDQVGRGVGDLMGAGANPPAQWPHQALEPVYTWNNTRNGTLADSVGQSNVIVENRDFYNQETSFNGSQGVGVGTLSSRPSTCTTGVAYWATDQGEWNSTNGTTPDGQLYKCTSTNTWTIYYKPYTYPHPLTTGPAGGGSGSIAPPAAPTNLTIN